MFLRVMAEYMAIAMSRFQANMACHLIDCV